MSERGRIEFENESDKFIPSPDNQGGHFYGLCGVCLKPRRQSDGACLTCEAMTAPDAVPQEVRPMPVQRSELWPEKCICGCYYHATEWCARGCHETPESKANLEGWVQGWRDALQFAKDHGAVLRCWAKDDNKRDGTGWHCVKPIGHDRSHEGLAPYGKRGLVYWPQEPESAALKAKGEGE